MQERRMTHMVVAVFSNIVEIIMLATRTYTLESISIRSSNTGNIPPTFCELCARFSCAKSEFGSTVPWKIDLYWFIPAFVKRSVGSDRGTTDDEGTAYRQYQYISK